MNHKQPFLQESVFPIDAPQTAQKNMLQRLVDAWLKLSGPDVSRFSASIEGQEQRRRSRLLSALFSLIIVVLLLAAPTAIPVPSYWIPIACFIVLSLTALLFNRMAQVTLSGILYILAIDVTLAVLMITLPTGIRNSNIPDFDLFIIPTLVGSVVLPRRVIPFLALLHIGLIIALFTLLPHDPLLQKEIQINQKGVAYSELSDAFIIQIVSAAIAWLAAWSVDRALTRASRAEELVEANRRIHEQTQLIVEQKKRLDYGVDVLKDAFARFANGDYRARVKLQDNELSSLAISFNLMVERLNRITQIAQEHSRLEHALQQLYELQSAIFDRGSFKPLAPTGTLVDYIYPTFQRYYQLNQAMAQSNAFLEGAAKDLTQQRTMLLHLESVLSQLGNTLQYHLRTSQTQPSTQAPYLEEAQQLCIHIHERCQKSLQEIKQLDQLLKKYTVGQVVRE
jgi:hypothetical protein